MLRLNSRVDSSPRRQQPDHEGQQREQETTDQPGKTHFPRSLSRTSVNANTATGACGGATFSVFADGLPEGGLRDLVAPGTEPVGAGPAAERERVRSGSRGRASVQVPERHAVPLPEQEPGREPAAALEPVRSGGRRAQARARLALVPVLGSAWRRG